MALKVFCFVLFLVLNLEEVLKELRILLGGWFYFCCEKNCVKQNMNITKYVCATNQLNSESKIIAVKQRSASLGTVYVWIPSVGRAFRNWAAKKAAPNQTSHHTQLWEERTFRCHFPSESLWTQPLLDLKWLKARFFRFGSGGKISVFGDGNHRWIETIRSHSAAYEQAQLEADSKHASQKLSHLVWFP